MAELTFENERDDASDEDDAESMTPAEVLHRLEEAWLNEKFSPELLEGQSEIVECMMEQLHEMEDNIRRARKTDFKVSLHKMEINRIRYVLSSYLRTRLKKIEQYTMHVLETENAQSPKLSDEELLFAKEYQANLEGHLKTLALRHMPQNLQNLDHGQTAVHPNLDSYVFMKVREDTEGVLVEEETAETREEIVDLQAGDQHILRYRPIASLLTSGAVSLI